ncbi:hypothetical protein OS493_021441 [Desmophyllum pertusum]|uniref:Uncharacterized protein n=1 Tax=Desmophyllum pertusum TaxID=174260 RepID=A0A9X0CRY2_9CNID|nr:hypothetical protein OS493_021441 [Desmophyllum pertusum]
MHSSVMSWVNDATGNIKEPPQKKAKIKVRQHAMNLNQDETSEEEDAKRAEAGIVADNFDLSAKTRIQSKGHSNQPIHKTKQYAIKDRVIPEPSIGDDQPHCRLADLNLQKLLPNSDLQNNFRKDCVILDSRYHQPAFFKKEEKERKRRDA